MTLFGKIRENTICLRFFFAWLCVFTEKLTKYYLGFQIFTEISWKLGKMLECPKLKNLHFAKNLWKHGLYSICICLTLYFNGKSDEISITVPDLHRNIVKNRNFLKNFKCWKYLENQICLRFLLMSLLVFTKNLAKCFSIFQTIAHFTKISWTWPRRTRWTLRTRFPSWTWGSWTRRFNWKTTWTRTWTTCRQRKGRNHTRKTV